MKKKITQFVAWLRGVDNRLWGTQLKRNAPIGFIAILLAVVAGAVLVVVERGLGVGLYVAAGVLALAAVVESIVVACSAKVAIFRSLLYVVAVGLSALIGAAVVVVAIAVMVVMLVSAIISLANKQSDSPTQTNNNNTLTEGDK